MIHSLFTVNSSGDVFLEKHWKSVISRSIVDYFFDAQVVLIFLPQLLYVVNYLCFLQNKATNPIDIPPVIATPHHYLISIYRCVIQWYAFFIRCCLSGQTYSLWQSAWLKSPLCLLLSSCTAWLTPLRTTSPSAPRLSSRTTMLLYMRLVLECSESWTY